MSAKTELPENHSWSRARVWAVSTAVMSPCLCVLAFSVGGQMVLWVTSAVLSGLLLFLFSLPTAGACQVGGQTGTPTARSVVLDRLANVVNAPSAYPRRTANSACFMIEIDSFQRMREKFGPMQGDVVADRILSRLAATLRPEDTLERIGDGRFCVVLKSSFGIDIERCIQLAGRLQMAVEKSIQTDRIKVDATASIGFCPLDRAPSPSADDWLDASEIALGEALRQGPGGICGFTRDLQTRSQVHAELRNRALSAFANGEIRAWFQPQISTDTGDMTGFEALARWVHPSLGVLGPAQFLPALEELNLMERLGEEMLRQSIDALAYWEGIGVEVPCVGVNFSESDLRNPDLVPKLIWALEAADVCAKRLTVEILENVVTEQPDDDIAQTLMRLADLGCGIDMDDFGTGNASLSAVRRLRVSRIKLDRCLVQGLDKNTEQQKVVSAVLMMSEKLGLDTLAEGVETRGEHAMLAQLGCQHVQGYGIAMPMPLEDCWDWVQSHRAQLAPSPQLGGRTG